MALPYEIQLAGRNLTRHPWVTAAMVVGLSLAVLVMFYIPSNMGTFYEDLIDRIVEQNSAHVTVWPLERQPGRVASALRAGQDPQPLVALTDRTFPRERDLNGRHILADMVAQQPGIVAVASFVRGDATVSRGRVNVGIQLEGIEPQPYARVVNIAKHFPDHRVPKLGPDDIAIGFRLADKLGVIPGDSLYVAAATAQRKLKVKAIFRSGYYDKDLQHAYVSLSTGQKFLGMGSEISGLAARCTDLNRADEVSDALRAQLPLKIRNWRDDNAALLEEIGTFRAVTLLINILIAAVASVGMANVFSMFILNRQKELAILRAVGASRVSLRVILLLEGSFVWLAGTALGCAMGLGVMAYEQGHPYKVSEETYGIGSFATAPRLEPLLIAVVLAALTIALSAWWSGRRAVKLSPIQVINAR